MKVIFLWLAMLFVAGERNEDGLRIRSFPSWLAQEISDLTPAERGELCTLFAQAGVFYPGQERIQYDDPQLWYGAVYVVLQRLRQDPVPWPADPIFGTDKP